MFCFDFKAYHGDVDDYGVLYHANYLRYFEYARREILDSFNLSHLCFAVKRLEIDYMRPILKGRLMRIETRLSVGTRPMLLEARQGMRCIETRVLYCEMRCDLVSVSRNLGVIRISDELIKFLQEKKT